MTRRINLIKSNIFLKDNFIKFYLFIAVSLWCIIFSFPLLFKPHHSDLNYTLIIKNILSNICHQRLDRTIYIDNIPLLVCSRCTGIYIGALLSSFINIFIKGEIKISSRIFFASSIPIIIDVIFHSAGIYSYSKTIAFITGLIFGSIGFLFIFGSVKLFFNETRILN